MATNNKNVEKELEAKFEELKLADDTEQPDENDNGDENTKSNKEKLSASKIKISYIKIVKELAETSLVQNNKDAALIVNKLGQVLGQDTNTIENGVEFHASLNAVVAAAQSLEDCTLYVNYYPCNECAKLITVSKIKEVFYVNDNDVIKELFQNETIQNVTGFRIENRTQ